MLSGLFQSVFSLLGDTFVQQIVGLITGWLGGFTGIGA
jgi:hypothetical protein